MFTFLINFLIVCYVYIMPVELKHAAYASVNRKIILYAFAELAFCLRRSLYTYPPKHIAEQLE